MLGVGVSLKALRGSVASGAAAFTPASLSGLRAWYEPSTTTAFRSTTDLTPCGVGDSCGFLLDKSQGAGYSGGSFTGLGSELVTNGDGSSTTGWTVTALVTQTVNGSNQFVIFRNAGTTSDFPRQDILETGKTYFVTLDVISASDNVQVYSGTPSGDGTVLWTSPSGTVSGVFTAEGPEFRVGPTGAAPATCTIDNISVRELPGNHATQGTAAARPILARVPSGGRRNLLERTEEFDNAYWTKTKSSIAQNAINSPIGALEADKIVESAVFGEHLVRRLSIGTGQKTASVYFKAAERTQAAIYFFNATDGVSVTHFDLSAGTVLSGAGIIEAFSDGWYRCSLTRTATADDEVVFATVSGGSTEYTGDGTSGIYIWGTQLEAASSASAYQKVVDQYDITEAGVTSVSYVFDDEVDDAISWTAPADTDYTIARVDTGGTVTILTGQSLSGATDILLEQDVAGYVAVDRALTSQETTDLTAYLEALA